MAKGTMRTAVLLLLLLGAAAIPVMVPVGTAVAQSGPPATGDWTVTGSERLNDTNITVEGDIIVKQGGALVLEDVLLRMKAGTDGGVSIRLEKGGSMTIKETQVYPLDDRWRYKVDVRGTLFMNSSIMSNVWGDRMDPLRTGVMVNGGTVRMEYSVIDGAAYTGLCIIDGTADLTGSNINANGWAGIFASGGNIDLLGTNVFDNKGPGIYISNDTAFVMDNGFIGNNERGGAMVAGSSLQIMTTSISLNGGDGVEALDRGAEIILDDCLMTSNSGWAVISVMGPLNLTDMRFSRDGAAPNSLGNVVERSSVTVKVLGAHDDRPWADATVELVPGGGPGTLSASTDPNGIAVFAEVVHYTDVTGLGEKYLTPYTVRCSDEIRGFAVHGEVIGLEEDLWGEGGVVCKIAMPDIEVDEMSVSVSKPTDGDVIRVTARVFNNGTLPATGVVVELYDGSTRVASTTIDTIGPMSGQDVSFKYDTSGKVGKHSLRLVADPGDEVPEASEIDNEATAGIDVQEDPRLMYAIPVLIVVVVAVFTGIKAYRWYTLRKLEKEQDAKGSIEWEAVENGNGVRDDTKKKKAKKGGGGKKRK